jgi:hypothetical protein
MTHWLTTLASFTHPVHIGTTPASLLWIVPLIASIAIVYKATKVHHVDGKQFPREVLALFGSILAFIVIAALILVAVWWVINDVIPAR